MRCRIVSYLLLIFFSVGMLNSNTFGSFLWEKFYDGLGDEFIKKIHQTSDGGYIVAATSDSFKRKYDNSNIDNIWDKKTTTFNEIWILKLDWAGNIEWQKIYGYTEWDRVGSIQQTQDSGYIVIGSSNSFENYNKNLWSLLIGFDIWVLKLDKYGNIQWQKIYIVKYDKNDDKSQDSYGNYIQQTSDGGYILIGDIYPFSSDKYGSDILVIKLDKDGDIQWQKSYDVKKYNKGNVIKETQDGGYILLGSVSDSSDDDPDILVMKIDKDGNIKWGKIYGGIYYDDANSLQITSDGGYVVAGSTYSFGAGGTNIWVLKLDKNGNIQWQKTYGGDTNDYAYSIKETSDGGYIVGGETYFFSEGSTDMWILKLDKNGNIQWQKIYDTGLTNQKIDEVAKSIEETSDGNYIIAADVDSSDILKTNVSKIWILKIDKNGDVPNCNGINSSNITPIESTTVPINVSGYIRNYSIVVQDTHVDGQKTRLIPFQVCSYSPVPYYGLTVEISGTGSGKVISKPAGIDCDGDCAETYEKGTTVQLTATPDKDSYFDGWGGDCFICDKKNTVCTIILDADKKCIAVFRKPVNNNTGSSSDSGGGSSDTIDLSGCSMVSNGNLINTLIWFVVPAVVIGRKLKRK